MPSWFSWVSLLLGIAFALFVLPAIMGFVAARRDNA